MERLEHLFANRKIKDNESCPCGSGIRFLSCCKGKPLKVIATFKKPADVQIMEKMRMLYAS